MWVSLGKMYDIFLGNMWISWLKCVSFFRELYVGFFGVKYVAFFSKINI